MDLKIINLAVQIILYERNNVTFVNLKLKKYIGTAIYIVCYNLIEKWIVEDMWLKEKVNH